MSYNKPTKYKILDMKNNQQLINDGMVIVKIPHETTEPKITIAMVMETLTNFMNEQIKFNEEQRTFNQKIITRLDQQDEFNQYVRDVFKRNNLK